MEHAFKFHAWLPDWVTNEGNSFRKYQFPATQKKITEFRGKQGIITVFARSQHWCISLVTCICGGGIPTINIRLQMVCTFIGTLCKYTTRIMRSLKRCTRCYWSAVDCDGRATVVEVGWRRCCLEDCWECCSSPRLARCTYCSVRPDEAREWVDPAGFHLSLRRPAPVPGYIATYRTCRSNTRNALLELYVLTGPCHLDWLISSQSQSQSYFTTDGQSVSMSWCRAPEVRRLLNCLEADPSENTARNNTCCFCWLPWKVLFIGLLLGFRFA
jgi:hypothetical protein